MRGLFDVSILLGLLDRRHLRHNDVREWFTRERAAGWASCPMTQNGFVRIISQKSYTTPWDIGSALAGLRAATARPDHAFWPDDLSLLDAAHIDHTRLLGPRQITDVYLLALAVKHGGRLVTLDTGISFKAARGATTDHLVVL